MLNKLIDDIRNGNYGFAQLAINNVINSFDSKTQNSNVKLFIQASERLLSLCTEDGDSLERNILIDYVITKIDDISKVEVNDNDIPTNWFKTQQISTWIGESLTTEGKEINELKGGHGILIVMHQCGDNKKALIGQLKTMISGIEDDFNFFAG